jgi:hypothetical protein
LVWASIPTARFGESGILSQAEQSVQEWESVANAFRGWVCRELAAVSAQERDALRGDYLFSIDGVPRFIVFVEASWSGSAQVGDTIAASRLDDGVPSSITFAELNRIVEGGFRTRISTTTRVLERLLLGTMRARQAYLSGMVTIEGDLPSFLKLVALLKARGITPQMVSIDAAGSSDVQHL